LYSVKTDSEYLNYLQHPATGQTKYLSTGFKNYTEVVTVVTSTPVQD